MQTQTARQTPATAAPVTAPARDAFTRPEARTRAFGVGYGSSSGYASQRRYAQDWAAPRFRFA